MCASIHVCVCILAIRFTIQACDSISRICQPASVPDWSMHTVCSCVCLRSCISFFFLVSSYPRICSRSRFSSNYYRGVHIYYACYSCLCGLQLTSTACLLRVSSPAYMQNKFYLIVFFLLSIGTRNI